MEFRDWLAGCAAAALLGITPAVAQGQRSLFDALPSPGAAPVTTGLERAPSTAPKPAAEAAKAAKDTPAKQAAKSSPPMARPAADAAAAPAQSVEKSRAKPERRRRVASADPALTLAPEQSAAPPAQGAPQAAAPSPAAERKPMTRAERRSARREARQQDAAAAAAPSPQVPTPPANPFVALFNAPTSLVPAGPGLSNSARGEIDALVHHHAKLNGVPESLVHRVIIRESRYNPRAVGRGGAMGLMQIKTATARGLGYTGGAAGLLDAETNLTYGIKYLAGAWRVSGGSHDRAVSHYARGYYYAARAQGVGGRRGRNRQEPETTASAAPQAPSLFTLFSQTPR